MELIIIWIVIAAIVGAIGSDRDMGFWGVFAWSVLLSPLVGIIVCMVAKSRSRGDMERQMAANIHTQTTLAVQNSNKSNQQSVSDELAKLKKLKDDGVINEEEYTKMKNKLIATFD